MKESDRSFGSLAAPYEKEMRLVVSPIHRSRKVTMRALGPQGSMGLGAHERGQTRSVIRVKPWALLASEVVMEERQWKALLSARKSSLGPERLTAVAARIQKSEEVKQGVDV